MPRKPRVFVDDGQYHLIARGNNRLFIFAVPGGYEAFLQILQKSKEKYRWKLFHYCLMTNHIHLLGTILRGDELPKLMQYLLFEYSRWYRKHNEYVGHLWQGRYKNEIILKESYFLECGRYIERNPLRAKIVKQLEDYSWSSYRHYALGEKNPLIDDNPYYDCLGSDKINCCKNYQDYVRLQGPYDQIVDRTLTESYF